MTSMMKNLMDDFYTMNQLSLDEGHYDAAAVYNLGESQANNCHGKTDQEIIEYMRVVMVPSAKMENSDEELEAYREVQLIVDQWEANCKN